MKKYHTKKLYVRIWGGELFQDKFGDAEFDVYKKLCDKIVEEFGRTNPNVNVEFNFMTNGIWNDNFNRIVELAKSRRGWIGFSYDPVGRYGNDEQRKLVVDNINRIVDALGYANVATTLTRPSIKQIVSGKDFLYNMFTPNVALEINSYIPNKDWQMNLPDDGQVF